MFTTLGVWDVKICSHLMSAFVSVSLSKFNIVSISMQMLMQKMGFRPNNLCIYVCITIDAMLNFDSDIDANADIKC